MEALKAIGQSYTTETLKQALAQSTLNKEQIKTILSANGLQGELLETTADEVANAAGTNMVAASQKKTIGTTLGLGTAFKGLWIVIKKATVAMVKFLFTNPVGWATLAVSAIASIVFGVKQYRENITKAAEESKEAINEITDSYKELNSTVNNVKKKYAELAQGVNQFTGENKRLSNDEYAEFLDLSNQLAESFPSLLKGYDENGNAILNLSGDVNTITDSLTNLVEVEKQLANEKIIDEIPNVLKGYNQNRSDLDNELKSLEQWHHDLEVAYESLQDINKVYETGFMNNKSGYLETLHVLSDLGIEFESIDSEEGFGFGTIALENYDDSLNEISRSLKTVTRDISNLNLKIKSENAEFNKYLTSWLSEDWSYVSLDTELQNIIQEMLFNTDWLSQAKSQGINTKDWDEVSEWIEKNYISAIANIDDNKVKSALLDIYSIPTNDQSLSEYVEQFKSALETIQTYCEVNGVKIPIEISNNNAVDTYRRLRNSIRQITDNRGITDREQYSYLMNEIDFQSFTQEQAELWLTSTLGAENATEAVQQFRDAIAAAKSEDDDPITFSSLLSDESLSKFQSTIDSLKSSLTTLYNGDYSSTELISALTSINKALTDIGKEKVLNWEEITNIDDLDNIIEQITNEYVNETLESLDMAGTDFGNTIRNVIQEELKASRQLETYKSNVSDLQTAYSNLTGVIETYNANGCITFDQLTSLLEMEPQYLSCLIDENGQLQLNEQAMADLAQLRLDEARTQVVQEAISELNRLSEEKQTQAVNDNSNAYIQNIKTISQWNNALGTAMQNAGLAAPLFAELSAALGGAVSNGASDEAINQVLDNAYKKFQMIGQIQSSIGSNLGGVLDKASSSSDTASSSTNNYEEQFDFFERRVEVLDNAVSLLKENLENLTGSFAKNQLLDQNSNILEERMRNYSDAVKMYQEKAQEALSKLDLETQKKIIDGSVSLADYIGEENEAVVEAMDDYKGWSDKVAECTEELASLKEELRQLELEKFNHIIQDFTDQFDLRDNAKDLIDKQIALFEEAGQLIGKAFYEEQINQSQKQLSLLENEKAQLVNQLSSAISSGRVQKGTEEWLEMVNALSDVDGSILDCKKSIEEFDNAILNLHWEIFDRVQDTFGDLSDEISNLIGVMDGSDVATKDNQWTKEGLTQLGLYAQQYELATYQVSQYADEIDKLSADYLLGKYSATEYADKLFDLNSAQWDAVNAAENAKASIMDLNEARVNIVVEGIRKEIDAYKELIDSQITALDAEKDLHEYQNSIAEKSNNIAKLEKQLAAMQNDNTAAAIAKRKQLEEQLAEAKADLDQTQYEHSVETQKEALNQQYQDYEDARNKEIESLEATLKDKENIIASSMESVKQHTQVIANQITDIANQHGVNISNALTSSWASGENAIASYGEVLSQGTSMFIENIMGIENQIYQLQVNADVTAISLANMLSANADNLVNELNTSYFAEANLLNMTNALHDSLISTLQGGYDVSSIVNSLNAVTEAANKARAAASSIGNSNISTASIPTGFKDLDEGRKYFVKDENNKTLFVGSPSQCQTWISAHNYSLGSIIGDDINVIDNNKKTASYSLSSISSAAINIGKKAPLEKYASGARNITEDQLAITNEAGQELIYHAADGSILTPLRQGDKVFDDVSAERLWDIGHGLMPPDIAKNLTMPTVLPNNVNNNSVNVHYDNMIAVQGSLNSTDVKQMEAIVDRGINKLVNKIHDGLTYGR